MIAYRSTSSHRNVGIDTSDCAGWQEEEWRAVRALGGFPRLDRVKAHPRNRNGWVYDARVMPAEACEHVAQLDATIRRLQEERQAWINEHFREWPVMTPENAPVVFNGQSKATAQGQLAKLQPSATKRQIEQQVARNLGRALSSGRRQ